MSVSASSSSMPSRRKRTRSLACMKLDKVVGSGTFGVVYKAVDKTNEAQPVVALKKIKMELEKQGFPLTAIREIKILNMMKHENIVQLREVITYYEEDKEEDPSLAAHTDLIPGDVFMVFEYVDYELANLLKSPKFRTTPTLLKSYAHQLLQGVNYLHENKVLHRDIKSANLLITRGNVLKIADWGLARSLPMPGHRLTVPVVTLWYRSPELILGRNQYGSEIDMWSVGCIFGEMATRVAMFPGDRENTQLELIFSLLGCPQGPLLETYQTYPQHAQLFPSKTLYPRLSTKMSQYFDSAGHGLSLLSGLLELDPSKRLSAAAALQHPYFTPPPPPPKDLPPIHLNLTAESEAEAKRQEQQHHQLLRNQQQQLLQLQQVHPSHPPGPTAGASRSSLPNPSLAPAGPAHFPRGPAGFDPKKEMRNKHRAENENLRKFQIKKGPTKDDGAGDGKAGVPTSSAPVPAPAPGAGAGVGGVSSTGLPPGTGEDHLAKRMRNV